MCGSPQTRHVDTATLALEHPRQGTLACNAPANCMVVVEEEVGDRKKTDAMPKRENNTNDPKLKLVARIQGRPRRASAGSGSETSPKPEYV
mmetsp:Transcript_17781/g.49305  ORF Transcript_17781/g.49305 Transcript_17781/m.49305 type:complete len:91 (-) Transcript_17781:395-667(-)